MQDEVRSKRLRLRRDKSEENVADLGTEPLSKAVIAKHSLTLGYFNMAEDSAWCKLQDVPMFGDFGSMHIVTGGRTVSAQNTAGDHVKKKITCSQKQRQRQRQAQHTTIAQDEFGGDLRIVPSGRVHRAVARETRRKELTSMTKEALDIGDEDGKKKVKEHTAAIDVQGESRVRTIGQVDEGSLGPTFESDVFTVLLCHLSHKVDSAEGRC